MVSNHSKSWNLITQNDHFTDLSYMSLKDLIDTYQQVQSTILEFIEDEEQSKDKYSKLERVLTNFAFNKSKYEFTNLMILISSISDNHHRDSEFFAKISKIISFDPIKNRINDYYSNLDIFKFFKNNKRILLFLINENILIPDDEVNHKMNKKKYKNMDYKDYLFSSKEEDFLDKQNKGENDSYICELIRKDLIDEFIPYLAQNNISAKCRVNHSIFESNIFLIGKNPLLIEYAAFYGSIQIFQYLKMNSSEIPEDIWLYAIHSKSGELISQIESLSIKPKDPTYVECFLESIKCHHYDVATYLVETYIDKDWLNDQTFELVFKNRNYMFYPNSKEYYLDKIPTLLTNKCFELLKIVINNDFEVGLDKYCDFRDSRKLNEFAYESYIIENKYDRNKYVIKISKQYFPAIEEFSTVIKCNYPSVLKFRGYCPVVFNDKKRQAIIVDYFQYNLHDYIFKKDLFRKSETTDYILILGITIGMRYLHKKGIIHRLFCPQTILLDEYLYPIISEFEVTDRLLDNEDQAFYPEEAKIYPYLAPEFLNYGNLSAASNVFAFSYIVYQIVTKRFHYERRFGMGFLHKIENGYRPDTHRIENKSIIDLIVNCWDQDPNKRMTFDQILEFITNEEFISSFESIDIEKVKWYLHDTYGDEFKEIIDKL